MRQRLAIYAVSVVTSNRGLVVNSSTGVHLSLASGNAKRRLTVNVQPGAQSISYLRRSWVQPLRLLVCRKSFSLLGFPWVPKSGLEQLMIREGRTICSQESLLLLKGCR